MSDARDYVFVFDQLAGTGFHAEAVAPRAHDREEAMALLERQFLDKELVEAAKTCVFAEDGRLYIDVEVGEVTLHVVFRVDDRRNFLGRASVERYDPGAGEKGD